MWLKRDLPKPLRCSFCRKTQDVVAKLVCSPGTGSPRAYICNECVAVCQLMLEDDRQERPAAPAALRDHPRAGELCDAVAQWITLENAGLDASGAIALVREIANDMIAA